MARLRSCRTRYLTIRIFLGCRAIWISPRSLILNIHEYPTWVGLVSNAFNSGIAICSSRFCFNTPSQEIGCMMQLRSLEQHAHSDPPDANDFCLVSNRFSARSTQG